MKASGMKRLVAGVMTLLLTLSLPLSLAPAAFAAEEHGWAADIPKMLAAGPYVEGEAVVAVDPAYADGFDLATLMGLRESLDGEELMTVPEEGASRGEAVLTYVSRPGRSTEELLYALARDDRVVYAEPNYVWDVLPSDDEAAQTAALLAEEIAAPEPKDPWDDILPYDQTPDLTDSQWGPKHIHVPNFGGTGSNMDGELVVVAVVDFPVDFSNPDLAPVAFTFTKEQQEQLGCDEHGFNASWQSADGKLELIPGESHGTHCAGIIGAAWDGRGISGAASNVRLVSVQLAAFDGKTSLVNGLRAYDFINRANELGANIRIASNSWSLEQTTLAMNAAMRAVGEAWGTVSVAVAANDGSDLQDVEDIVSALSANPYVILVAASTPADVPSWFSNYNAVTVDLASPGEAILSTVLPEDGVFEPALMPD